MATRLKVNRILVLMSSLFVTLGLLFGLYQYKRERDFRVDVMNSQLQMYNYQMAFSLGADSLRSSESVSNYVNLHSIFGMRITVIDTLGNVLADSQQPDVSHMDNHLKRSEVIGAISNGSGYAIKRHSESTELTYFYSASKISMAGNPVIVRAAVPYNAQLSDSLSYNNTFIYFALVVVLLVGFVTHGIMFYYLRMRDAENEKERMKRQLTQNVTHELKTPAASIQGFLETIIQNPELDEAHRQHFLQRCYAQSQRMSKLLQDMATLTKLDSKQNFMQSVCDVNISDLIHNVLDDTCLLLREKNITPVIDIPESLELHNVDMGLIYGIFRNLVDNAISYASHASYLSISGLADGEILRFQVSDNGLGVQPENLSLIFERFFREDKGRSRKLGGTGLGLAIVRNTVTLYGGEIEASITPGGGLTVKFSLEQQR